MNDLAVAIRTVFSAGGARDRKTAIREVARELGYARVGPNIQKRVDDALRTAVRRGIVQNDGTWLRLDRRSINDYSRDELVRHLLAALDRTWWLDGAAVYWTAYYLGYRRVSASMFATLKSTIAVAIRRGLLEREGEQIRKRRG